MLLIGDKTEKRVERLEGQTYKILERLETLDLKTGNSVTWSNRKH